MTSSTAYIRPSVDYSSEQQQQNRSYLRAEPGLSFIAYSRCAAAIKTQSEPGLKLTVHTENLRFQDKPFLTAFHEIQHSIKTSTRETLAEKQTSHFNLMF